MTRTPLIPRGVLWANPDRVTPRLSPDGKRLAYLAPVDGVLNLWVGPAGNPDAARAITREKGRPIAAYHWAYTNGHILYVRDTEGNENWHLHAVDVETGKTRDLTPLEGVRAGVERLSARFPGEALVGMNDRNPELMDLYRIDIATGARTLVEENTGFIGFITDDEFRPRVAVRILEDGAADYHVPDGAGWRSWIRVPHVDTSTFGIVDVAPDGESVYAVDARGRDTSALVRIRLDDATVEVMAKDDACDVGATLQRRSDRAIWAVSFERERMRWEVLDDEIRSDLATLATLDPGDLSVVSQTLDDRRWVVAFQPDDGPVRYHLWDRAKKEATYLFSHRRALESEPLVPMRPVVIPSRDSLELVSYLSLPRDAASPDADVPVAPLPMVLLVHGGPWARDAWGFHPVHQILTNRGYAVLSVNFRGSTGFGKAFVNAGDGEWARKMHDDLLDALEWAVARGIADRDRVAIMGGSYGGYATLVGLTTTPEVFACGIDIVGPSNLRTLLASVPPYWKPFLQVLRERVGDERTPEGRALLDERSPLSHVDRIRRPLLIGQGANDPRVKRAESDQIAAAMKAKGIPVSYVLFPDEGHGFARPENNKSFFAVAEAFLAEHLGGRLEPLSPADFEGSTIEVLEGAEGLPGIEFANA